MLQAGRKTIGLAVYVKYFNAYNANSVIYVLFYKPKISSRLLSVVVHALEHFRCLNIFVENRRIYKYIIHYERVCTYF
jgi:hypothetical protein